MNDLHAAMKLLTNSNHSCSFYPENVYRNPPAVLKIIREAAKHKKSFALIFPASNEGLDTK